MKATRDSKTLVTFWGTRGSISTPGRMTEKYGGNTPCVSVRNGDNIIILDAGTGIRNLGIELVDEMKQHDDGLQLHLFLSHTHWDHIQGLPFFQPAYIQGFSLSIYGSPNKERFLASILKDQMDYDYFPVAMSALTADINIHEISKDEIRIGPVVVDWQEQVCHPGGSVRYRMSVGGKKIVYATDVELDAFLGGEESRSDTESLAEEYMAFIHGADLLVADGQYTGEEYPHKKGWGHTSLPVLLDAVAKSFVKQIAVFHHDPQHSDKFLDELWMKHRTGYRSESHEMELFWAREGLTLAV
ncbi:MAG: MBL fold metallo-hydrolase [Pseudomonadota bacterium]